jgi:hypothetical protein
MNTIAAIAFEGVLAKEIGRAPIPLGLRIYHGLAETFNLAIVTSESDEKYIEHWLRLEGLNKHNRVIYADPVESECDVSLMRWSQINRLQKFGTVELIVEPDPGATAGLLSRGYNVLNFLHALYAQPEWRPDYRETATRWGDISKEVELQRDLRTRDIRVGEDPR